jgi:hypothetical protein
VPFFSPQLPVARTTNYLRLSFSTFMSAFSFNGTSLYVRGDTCTVGIRDRNSPVIRQIFPELLERGHQFSVMARSIRIGRGNECRSMLRRIRQTVSHGTDTSHSERHAAGNPECQSNAEQYSDIEAGEHSSLNDNRWPVVLHDRQP